MAHCEFRKLLQLSTVSSAHSPYSLDTFGSITKRDIFVQGLLRFIPFKLLSYIPNPKMAHMRYAGKVLTDVARFLVKEKTEAAIQGRNAHDIMSILGKSLSWHLSQAQHIHKRFM
jgi:hypothetical protein